MKKFFAGAITATALILVAKMICVRIEEPLLHFHATPLFASGDLEVSRSYAAVPADDAEASALNNGVLFFLNEEWTFQNKSDASLHIEIPPQRFQVETVRRDAMGWSNLVSRDELPEQVSGISFDVPAKSSHVIALETRRTFVFGSGSPNDYWMSYTMAIMVNGAPKVMVARFQPTRK